MTKHIEQSVEQVRESHAKVDKKIGNRIAVIVRTQISKMKFSKGVQFWTKEMIGCEESINTDGSISRLVCIL
jgi:hypothetical protein